MYCGHATNHSGGVFNELARHSGPASLENAWAFWAARFVASTRAPKLAMGDLRFCCSDSSETTGSEWQFLLRYSVVGADKPAPLLLSVQTGEGTASPLLLLANIVK